MKILVDTPRALAVLLVVMVASTSARANFASDPTRKNSTSFTKFFLKRFDKWFVTNVGDPRKGLDKAEVAFIDEYLRTVPSFGTMSDGAFVRFIRYGITIDGENSKAGPYRFVLSGEQSKMKSTVLELAKAKGVTLDKSAESSLEGIGFTGSKGEIELVFKDTSGSMIPDTLKKSVTKKPVWITRLYRGGKLASSEFLELDIETHGICLGARSFSQVDRLSFEGSESTPSCHITLFEDRALLPAARTITVKIRRGINLVPGALEVSGKHVRAFYP